MSNFVARFRNTVAKLNALKSEDVFIYGGCQKTGMPLRFIARPLLNRSLIIERIECSEVSPETATAIATDPNTPSGNVYKGNIAFRHDVACPHCGPSGFIVCDSCGSFNCYSQEASSSRRFSCATCGRQARVGDGPSSTSFVAALHSNRPAAPLHSFDPLRVDGPKAQTPLMLPSPVKRLR